MPKMKTHSGAKKRFSITSSRKVKAGQAGKNHMMINKSKDQSRNLRGTTILAKADGQNIKKYFLPNG